MLLSLRPTGCENRGVSVETLINLLAVVGSAITLYFLLRRPIDHLESKLEGRIDALESKFDRRIDTLESKFDGRIDSLESKNDARFSRVEEKIDGVHSELVEFRLETREVLARHDERITSLEMQRPRLQMRS